MKLVVVLLALVLAATTANAQPSVEELLKKAKAHFDVQEYTDAEAILKDAYKLDPRPQILYALAQAQRLAGECDRAVTSYQNFLRTNPPTDQAKLARDNIATCSKPAPVEPTPAPPPSPAPPPPAPPASPPPAEPPHAAPEVHGVPWAHDWLGHVLVIGGLAAGLGGGYLALSAQHTIDSIDSATFYDDFLTRSKEASSAKSQRTLGLVTAGAGAALVIAGIVTYVVRSPRTETVQVSIGPRGELGVAWGF